YFNFFTNSFADSMLMLGWEVDNLTLNVILPVGISFYSFQTLSYTIDIYRKNSAPTKDFVSFFTFVSFFPQLVAGPVERASNLLPQIERPRVFQKDWFKAGIFQILVGLFRKIAIADNLGIYVDSVYSNIEIHNSSTLLLATIFYAFQIYYDFAGYSDIAIGSAKLFGFRFNRNFDFPYFSKSITEFWRRWHMSLSFWLRDYLYISLGGNRKGIKITYRNLLITMLLGGLWHGSSWNFIIWGGIHGIFLSLEKLIFTFNKKKSFGALGYCYTFVVVLFTWVFFRTSSFSYAIIFFENFSKFDFWVPFIGDSNGMANTISMLSLGLCFDLFINRSRFPLEEFGKTINDLRFSFAISTIILVVCLFYSSSNNFIYFQF
ncbi:MAG: MBOAT family O-acyltransferase, partial [Aurantibacter sp.]